MPLANSKLSNRLRGIFALIAVLALGGFSLPSWAVPEVSKSDLSLLPVISSLLVVIAVILILAMGLKKFNLGFPGSRAIKVVSALSLGTRERVVVIEVNGKQHVLGVTAQQINHLFTLDEPLEGGITKMDGANEPLTFQKILENLGKKND